MASRLVLRFDQSMGDEAAVTANATLVQSMFEAFGNGSFESFPAFDDRLSWHEAGTHPLTGDFLGRDAVFAHFRQLGEFTRGVLNVKVVDVLASPTRAAALFDYTIGRPDGATFDGRGVQIFAIDAGVIVESWGIVEDQAAMNLFMSTDGRVHRSAW